MLFEDARAICTGSPADSGGFRRNTAESDGGGVYMTGGYSFGDDADAQCSNAGCR